MDIALVGKNSIKIKGKQVSFIVDPAKDMQKTAADGIILLDTSSDTDLLRVTDSRIVINGPGEYEVGRAKVSGIKTQNGIFYKFLIDGINVVLGLAMNAKMEGSDDCGIAIIKTDADFNEAFVTGLEPKMAVLYGDNKSESAKKLNTENIAMVPKITILKDKLPEKMEIVVLG